MKPEINFKEKFDGRTQASRIAHDRARDAFYAERNAEQDAERASKFRDSYNKRRKREHRWLLAAIVVFSVSISAALVGFVLFVSNVYQTKSSIFQKVDK